MVTAELMYLNHTKTRQ